MRVERVVLNALATKAREAQLLHFAADCCGDCAKAGDELSEDFRRKRLVAIALGLLRRIMHFDHQRVRTGSDSSERHLRHELAETQGVRWVDDHWQMRF